MLREALEGDVGGFDSGIDVVPGAIRTCRPYATGARVKDREALVTEGGDPFAVDVAVAAEQVHVRQSERERERWRDGCEAVDDEAVLVALGC